MEESKGTAIRACYAASVADFQKENVENWLKEMEENFYKEYRGLDLSSDQDDDWNQSKAWVECFDVMQTALHDTENPQQWKIIFEYRLPYEGGRRPDVILLSKDKVIVLEFKHSAYPHQIYMDQVLAYTRDLKECHLASRDKEIIPVLVLTKSENLQHKIHNVFVFSRENLKIHYHTTEDVDLMEWLNSPYEPLPTIIEAAKAFVKHKPLPQIRRARSAGVDDAIACLEQAADLAEREKRHVLAVVTGVPGSGKTFLGLKYVYGQGRNNAMFLSGNGPLVNVLNDALKDNEEEKNNKIFIKNVRDVLEEYVLHQAWDYNKNILVFDEGQRAWDAAHMESKNKYRVSKSEPELLVEMMKKRCSWGVLLVLIGEGQAINKGERGGVEQWAHAIDESWDVLCPNRLDSIFGRAHRLPLANRQHLDLTVSLRTHLAEDINTFVNFILEGKFEEAKQLLPKIEKEGFHFYVTRDLNMAKEYCRKRYKTINEIELKDKEDTLGDKEKSGKQGMDFNRYGILVSSKARGLKKHGIDNSYTSTKNIEADWFNKPMDELKSGGNFNSVVTEFGCQGLELDMPIVCWGNDMLWKKEQNSWQFSKAAGTTEEDHDYRINSYRVLLTRGRDGCIIFVPIDSQKDTADNDTDENLYDEMYDMLKTSVGIESLGV